MKKLCIFFIILIGLVVPTQGLAGLADDFTETAFAPEFEQQELEYYWGSKKVVNLQMLEPGTFYDLCIGTNQYSTEQQWINFTATHTNAEITFVQDSEPVDTNGDTIHYLVLSLYEGSTIKCNITYSVIYPTDQYNPGQIVFALSAIVGAVFIILVLIYFIRR